MWELLDVSISCTSYFTHLSFFTCVLDLNLMLNIEFHCYHYSVLPRSVCFNVYSVNVNEYNNSFLNGLATKACV